MLKTLLLRERMQDGYSVDYAIDIMAIIEEAIASLEKAQHEESFMTVLTIKYEEAAMFMLQPEDFKNINIPTKAGYKWEYWYTVYKCYKNCIVRYIK